MDRAVVMSADPLAAAVVRISGAAGVAGAGFLVAPGRVATCAHVVAMALGTDGEPGPEDLVQIDFPLLAPNSRIPARVLDWQPEDSEGTGDVAVLQLEAPSPPGALPAPSRITSDVRGHSFRTLGFPFDQEAGIWIEGKLIGAQGTGRIQIETTAGQWRIEPGFSGAPVWDDDANGVVGMVVTRTTRNDTTAHLVPTTALGDVWTATAENPYRGLKPLEEGDARLFHGRDAELAGLAEQVAREDLVVVAGPSGSGKSSLVRAGLLPRLRGEGARVFDLRPDTGTEPVAMFAAAVGQSVEDPQAAANALVKDGNTVLFVDQFEEIVVADRDGARRLLELLTRMIASQRRESGKPAPLRVMLTLRARSLDTLVTRETADRLNKAVRFLQPMSREELSAAITGPAAKVGGLAFESGLVPRILDDAMDQPGTLPLVSLVLERLWQQRHGGWLTHAAYEKLGRVPGALGKAAEEALEALRPSEKDRARRLLVQLARPDGDAGFARRSVRLSELSPELQEIAHELATRRLVVLDDDQRADLVHQALIDYWPQLRDWLAEDRDFLLWQADLRQDIDQWEQSGRDHGSLLRGAALATARQWLTQRGSDITAPQREYVERSHAAERRGIRRWRIVTAVALTLALAASVLTVVVLRNQATINDNLHTANAILLAQESLRDANGQDTSALQMAQAAWRENPRGSEAYGALLQQELYWRGIDRILPPQHIDSNIPILSSSDGQRVVLRSTDPTAPATLWQGLAGPAPQSRPLGAKPTAFLELSPDGKLLAESGYEPGIKIWELDSAAPPVVLRADETTTFQFVSFSANGQYVLGVPYESTDPSRHVRIWDLRTRRPVPTPLTVGPGILTEPTAYPSDDGRQVIMVAPSADPNGKNEAVVRDAGTGERIRSLGHGVVLDHGRKIAACDGGTITLLDNSGSRLGPTDPGVDCSGLKADATGQFLLVNRPQDSALGALHWPDRKWYFFADPRTTVNWAANTSIAPLLVADPGGRLTALTIRNGSMQLSNVATAETKPAGTTNWRPNAQSPDGQRWAARTTHGELALVDAREQVLKQAAVPSPSALSFDSSGKHILSVSNGVLRTYRADDLSLEHETPLPGVPDPNDSGTIVAVPGQPVVVVYAKTATFWDPATGQQTEPPLPLPTQDDFAEKAEPRPGHPGQLFVYGGKTAALWDLPSRKAIETFHSDFYPGTPAIDPTGSFAAMVNGVVSGVVFLDLNANRMLPTMPAELNTLHGIDGDYLFGESTLNFQVWHWPDHKLVTNTKLGDQTLNRAVENGKLILDTRPGPRPSIPLDGAAWMRHLCGINNRDFTPAEKTRLPAGVEQTRPCP
ncbi:trypsin-like peptidase domain-containing protein [Amycolatopsis sp. WGS_07]|uniref:nSTAND1 domain-containing NTPase n=1 Tax=Amycolatopsis sp. WGS_07 TaxID=3076764 RepID=UPI003873243B